MKIKLSIILFFVVTQMICAQEPERKNRSVEKSTETISGRLENGFRYFIKPLDVHEEKIYTKLVINAGSLQENTDQYSCAHLLEHLAFNGTENFPSLRNNPQFYSQLKMEPRDLHAHMGGSQTNYNIEFPREVTRALDTALAIYHDIASGKVLLKEKMVEGERKAVYHEGADASDPGAFYPFLKIHSLLTGCMNIPPPNRKRAIIMNTSSKALKRFYEDWYRPDLITFIIVGNFKNVKEVEEKIREKFKDLPKHEEKVDKKDCKDNYLSKSNQFIIQENTAITSKESFDQTIFQFFYRNPRIYFDEFSKKENELVWELISSMTAARLKTSELNYGVNYTSFIFPREDLPAVELDVRTTGNIENAIKKVFKVIGTTSFGFQKEEWQPILDKKLEYFENKNYNSADFWLDALTSHIVEDIPLPDKNDHTEIEFLKTLDLEKINQLVKGINWMPDDIAIVIPKDIDKTSIQRSTFENWIKAGLSDPQEFSPIKSPDQLMSLSQISKLKEARIIERRFGDYNEDYIQLENGVKIILKTFQPESGRNKNKIMIHGFSPFGASCFGAWDMESILSPLIIQNSGVGKYNKFEIDEFLAKTSIPFGIRNYVEQTETGTRTEVSPEDLEIALQLIYLSFMQPRFDQSAFQDWQMQEGDYARRNTNPNNDFIDFINEQNRFVKMPQGGKRYRESLKVNYQLAFEKHNLLFGNTSDFIFILTGDFKKNDVLPLLQKYLGNLKNTDNQSKCKDTSYANSNSSNFTKHDDNLKLSYPNENTLVSIGYTSNWTPSNVKEEIKTRFLTSAMDIKLKGLRYDKNLGTYFAVASANFNYQSRKKFLHMLVHTSPNDFEKILKECNQYIEELKNEVVSKDFLDMVKKTAYLPKWQERFERTNRSMQMKLYSSYRYDMPYIDLAKIRRYMDEFTSHDLQQTAKEYLTDKNKLVFTASGSE